MCCVLESVGKCTRLRVPTKEAFDFMAVRPYCGTNSPCAEFVLNTISRSSLMLALQEVQNMVSALEEHSENNYKTVKPSKGAKRRKAVVV